jgi:non-heme chloroperoxidase
VHLSKAEIRQLALAERRLVLVLAANRFGYLASVKTPVLTAFLIVTVTSCAPEPSPPSKVAAATVAAPVSHPEWGDPSLHEVRFVDTKGARIEVLDWGGEGPPIVLVPGLGNSAHIYDDFAPSLKDLGHVYGVTRRGAGASKAINDAYDVPTLADDVVRVMTSLHVDQARLIGHSFGGEELTWIAAHTPSRVRSLVYLDAAYDHHDIQAALKTARPGTPREEPSPAPTDLHDPVAYQALHSRALGIPLPLGEVLSTWEFAPDGHFVREKIDGAALGKILGGAVHHQWESVHAPTLALFGTVTRPGASPDLPEINASQRAAFRAAMPTAQVVEVDTGHYLFLTARAETLSQVRAFVQSH